MKKENEQEDVLENQADTTNEDEEQFAEGEACNLEDLNQENAKLKDDFLRVLADMENMKKRCAQEIEKNTKYAVADFAKNLLAVADNLQRAIDAAKKESQDERIGGFLQGIELTNQELNKVFAKFGVKKMETMGTVFDPNYHRVVQEVENKEEKPGTIVAELQTGYMIEDRILREAMVVVTKK